MVRTYVTIDLDDEAWAGVKAAARADDVSPEAWNSYDLEQAINRGHLPRADRDSE